VVTCDELRTILEHCRGDMPVHIAGAGELVSVRHSREPWTENGLYLDVRGPMLKGTFLDAKTLRVRLEAMAS
jgi:hypothetical protein